MNKLSKPQFIELTPPSEKTIHVKLVDQEFLSNPLHFHELCELVLILESFGKRIVGNNVATFTQGDLVLMGPNIPHIWRNDDLFLQASNQLRARAIVVYFPADFLLRLTDEHQTIQAMQQFIRKAQRGLRFYGETLDKAQVLLAKLSDKEGFPKIIEFLNLIQLLQETDEFESLASEGYRPTFSEQETQRINKVYLYVMSNFKEDVNLQVASDMLNMTPNAFCRFLNAIPKSLFHDLSMRCGLVMLANY
ncbi:AraC family transcriptional regulator [Sphingobacterium sp. E70]|uniref:AraC family transcriptional regulator n=1 Tax=Sphingobacterium sp. E70 TaxID=2853439 RepID=UPI00211CE50F|nr:AraC family transcriptional regulator [Sphingobacterium sp. E70]ULT23717.1 AraC family transcriptional regulator [Sphingobacterium sp. E70]